MLTKAVTGCVLSGTMRRTLVVTVGLAPVAAVLVRGWWTYQNRVRLGALSR